MSDPDSTWGTLRSKIVLWLQEDQYDEAASIADEAVQLAEKLYGPHHPNVAISLTDRARCYRPKGKFTEGEPLLQRALAIREKARGLEHPDVAESLFNLACLYSTQGRFKEAIALHEQALSIREKILGSEHVEVANSLDRLGKLYALSKDVDKLAEAKRCHERALASDTDS